MNKAMEQSGKSFRTWYKRQSRVGRISFILTAAIVFMLFVGRLWHLAELLFLGPIILCMVVLSPLLIVLLHRWITQRLLWKVRNRLIVTYALMSLAPVILCLTLFAIASYVFGGQFATNSALTQLDQASTEVSDETVSATLVSLASNGRMLATQQSSRLGTILPISLAVVKSGTFKPMTETAPDAARNPFIGQPVPAWLFSGFRGLILFKDQLYLVAFTKLSQGGQTVTVLGSQPFNVDALSDITEDLGRVILMPGFSLAVSGKADVSDEDTSQNDQERDFSKLDAGTLPPRAHFFDAPVVFSAPTSVLSWQNGHDLHGIVMVFSRPSTLYTRLFASTNGLGTFVRIALLCIAIFFALLELFALLMAAGLSRTITRSVAELYRGTREIDRGNLEHRIVIKRKDQLGALATSFNGMTTSIVNLLAQQREKDRLLNELAIAQEVQTNLYPRSPVSFAQLEMHGVCMPARTVSGDYFDFIFGHGNGGPGSGLCLAFGDISGKGISAAMLMASLHSAVRAFNLNTEDGTVAMPSPALLLELLNQHLYRSTAPEKYATLFLAYYDVASRRLTYSNGGHLPPLVISTDGRVQQLDCGGPVVGLLNGLEYEEATVVLQPGDLMMAFTDGLTEPENETGEFGEQRLLDYVRVNKNEPLPELVAGALKTVQAWVGNQEQPDDMTLLLVRQI